MVKKIVSEYEDVFKMRWKVEPCFVQKKGKPCWCSCITVEDSVFWKEEDEEEVHLVSYGSMATEVAEHVVDAHNKQLGKEV